MESKPKTDQPKNVPAAQEQNSKKKSNGGKDKTPGRIVPPTIDELNANARTYNYETFRQFAIMSYHKNNSKSASRSFTNYAMIMDPLYFRIPPEAIGLRPVDSRSDTSLSTQFNRRNAPPSISEEDEELE